MDQNLVFIVSHLLKMNEISFDKKELSFQIQSHPSYPSLHAITGVLTHFNIENMALQVPVDEETLSQLPKHFIAQIKTEQGEDFAVVSNQGLAYDLIFSDKKTTKYTIDEFLDKFTGIMVAVEKDENQEIQKSDTSNFKKMLVWLTSLVIISIWVVSNPNLLSSSFLLASLLGIYISISIYKQEQGEKTSLGEAFCSGESKKSDCDSVINSKGANLFGFLKLSDLSLVYFAGLATLTFLVGVSGLAYSIPYLFGLSAVLITVYSLYYQAFVVKAWCGLCLSIVGVLWLQAIIVFTQIETILAFSFSTKEIILTVLSFSMVSAIWFYLKPSIENLKELKEDKIKYFKFKRNFNLFSSLLNQSDTINTQLPNTSEIVFGSKENTFSIVVITNPFCGHCRPVHTLIEKINKKYPDLVNITIRFNINTSDKESDVVKITSRLIELYHLEGASTAMQAMHAIYGGQDAISWLKEWGKCYEPDKYIAVLENQSEWCKNNNINFTPEILIEGQSFPKEYDRADLEFFIEELQENHLENRASQAPVYQTV